MWLILSLKIGSCDFLWVGPGTRVTGNPTQSGVGTSRVVNSL